MGPAAKTPLSLGLLACVLCGCGVNSDQRVQAYRQQQAHALMGEYERARAQGDALGMCVKSNQVAAAYVDARDPGDAAAWRSKNAEDCRAARAALVPEAAGQSGTSANRP
jgi:hypothetical protein